MGNLLKKLQRIWNRMEDVTEEEALAVLRGDEQIARGEYVVLARLVKSNTAASGQGFNFIARFGGSE